MSRKKDDRRMFMGPDGWHGSVYLEHGKLYKVLKMKSGKKGRTGNVVASLPELGDKPKTIVYHSEEEFESNWREV